LLIPFTRVISSTTASFSSSRLLYPALNNSLPASGRNSGSDSNHCNSAEEDVRLIFGVVSTGSWDMGSCLDSGVLVVSDTAGLISGSSFLSNCSSIDPSSFSVIAILCLILVFRFCASSFIDFSSSLSALLISCSGSSAASMVTGSWTSSASGSSLAAPTSGYNE